MELLKYKLSNFLELTRAYSLGMTFASMAIIYSWANYSERFSFLNFMLLIFATCCVHMGANLFDDYIDLKAKFKEGLSLEQMQFSTDRKAIAIRNKAFSMKEAKIILFILFSLASIIGIYFAFSTSWKVLFFALLGGILTLFYPISSKFNLAEVTVGLIFGPILIMGGYFALTQELNLNLFITSWAIFLTTIILLHVHNIMDWEFDVKTGKNTLAILSKSKTNAIKLLKYMIIATYTIIVIGVLFFQFNPKMCYVFLTLPLAIKLLNSIKEYIEIKDVKFETRWYYGPFENWKTIQERKLDFFMYRFYLARNYAFFFAIFASIGAII